MNDDDYIGGSISTATPLGVNAYTNSALETLSDQDWYAVNLVAGHQYGAGVAGDVSGALVPSLHIYDATGTEVSYSGANFTGVGFVPTVSGTYYLAVQASSNSTGPGTYILGMQTEGDDVAGSTSTLASLSTLPSNPGMLEQVNYTGDQDWYKVALTSGHTYKLSLAQAASSVVPDQNLTLQLLDASGSNVVISLDSTGTGTTLPIGVSNYLVTPSVSGTYYVDVSGVVSKTAPGFYYVSVSDKSIADTSNTYQINALSFSAVEGASGSSPYVFDVTRDNSASSASINWSLVGTGTNPSDASDFTGSLSGTVNFGVGENEQRITVYVSGDGSLESTETFKLVLSNPTTGSVATGYSEAYGVIRNDDGATTTNDYLTGTNASDTINGGSGQDVIVGLDGNDTLNGGDSGDLLKGGSGDDWLTGDAGDDALYGGVGKDGVNYWNASSGVVVNLKTGIAQAGTLGTDTLISIENVQGSSYNDSITMSDTRYGFAVGGAGNDTLNGGIKEDYFHPGSGNDVVDGGSGQDNVDYLDYKFDAAGLSTHGVTANIKTGVATDNWGNTDSLLNIEKLGGSDFADSLTGSDVANQIEGRVGDDTIDGGDGTDRVDFTGDKSNYALKNLGGNLYKITDLRTGSPDGSDLLTNVEQLKFADQVSDLSWASPAPTGSGIKLEINANNLGFTEPNGLIPQQILGNSVSSQYFKLVSFDSATHAFEVQEGTDIVSNPYFSAGGSTFEGQPFVSYLNDYKVFTNNNLTSLPWAIGEKVDASIFLTWANNNFTATFAQIQSHLLGSTDGSNLNGTDYLLVTRTFQNVEAGVVTSGFPQSSIYFGNDTLIGNAGNDSLSGYGGNDTLDGGKGKDTLVGGAGNDRYLVDSPFDVVVEALTDNTLEQETFSMGNNNDVVVASASYTLGAGVAVEDVMAAGTYTGLTVNAAIDLTGNELGQGMLGNDANNVLRGMGGDDLLVGFHGDDVLYGGDGNDAMIGGVGNDLMYGGAGGDFFVFNLATGNGWDLNGNAFTASFTGGRDIADGGDDEDWLFVQGERADFNISKLVTGEYLISQKFFTTAENYQSMVFKNIEFIQFNDQIVEQANLLNLGVDLNGSSRNGNWDSTELGPNSYYKNTNSQSGYSRSGGKKFWNAEIGLDGGIKSVKIEATSIYGDIDFTQTTSVAKLDWKFGYDSTSNVTGEVSSAAPTIAFNAANGTSQTFNIWDSATTTSRTFKATWVRETGASLKADASAVQPYLKLEALGGAVVRNELMQDALRQVGLDLRAGVSPSDFAFNELDLEVQISKDGTNWLGANDGQAGNYHVGIRNDPMQLWSARFKDSILEIMAKDGQSIPKNIWLND